MVIKNAVIFFICIGRLEHDAGSDSDKPEAALKSAQAKEH